MAHKSGSFSTHSFGPVAVGPVGRQAASLGQLGHCMGRIKTVTKPRALGSHSALQKQTLSDRQFPTMPHFFKVLQSISNATLGRELQTRKLLGGHSRFKL